MTVFQLPDLGEGLREAEIVEWHVAADGHVAAGDRLVTVETDKALVEVAAPWTGRVVRLIAVPGERVAVGAALAELDVEAPDAVRASASAHALPRVRALAAQLGVDLARVAPTGTGGSVTEADVRGAAGDMPAFEPLRGVRLAMARNMARSRAEVVPATVVDEIDVERWAPSADATVRLVRAIVAACAAVPSLNAWFDERRLARRLHARIDLGIAMQTADGLLVPVLHDVGRHAPADLRRTLDAIARAAEARTLTRDDLSGATFTLSNFGVLGGRFAALVVVPPQVAILGAGRIQARVVAAAGQPAVRRMLPLSLTFDHRAVTGQEAVHFLTAAGDDLAKEE